MEKKIKIQNKSAFIAFTVIILISIILGIVNINHFKSSANIKKPVNVITYPDGYIAKITIEGIIQEQNMNYNQKWTVDTIKKLKDDPQNKGLVLFINSSGGEVYEVDELYRTLEDYKTTGKKVSVYLGKRASSGAYLIACSGNRVYANHNTITGGICVSVGNHIEFTKLMNFMGIKYTEIDSNKINESSAMTLAMTKEETEILKARSDEFLAYFTDILKQKRGFTNEDILKVSDGRLFTAQQAYDNKLIDSINSWDVMTQRIIEKDFEGKEIPFVEFSYSKSERALDLTYDSILALEQMTITMGRYISRIGIPNPSYVAK